MRMHNLEAMEACVPWGHMGDTLSGTLMMITYLCHTFPLSNMQSDVHHSHGHTTAVAIVDYEESKIIHTCHTSSTHATIAANGAEHFRAYETMQLVWNSFKESTHSYI